MSTHSHKPDEHTYLNPSSPAHPYPGPHLIAHTHRRRPGGGRTFTPPWVGPHLRRPIINISPGRSWPCDPAAPARTRIPCAIIALFSDTSGLVDVLLPCVSGKLGTHWTRAFWGVVFGASGACDKRRKGRKLGSPSYFFWWSPVSADEWRI